jgi:predicted MFS family arabinose efflux permease
MVFNLSKSGQELQNYFVVTLAYWGFTLTDGAIRMLVVLYFYQLGYSPLEIALLFLFYELCGVVTNFIGGWMASKMGLNATLHLGMGLQILALLMLAVPVGWLSVPYVMLAQAVSGIAKDLNKMSAKSSVKLMLPEKSENKLFKWVAFLTGSKNSIKGLGFFLGGVLLNVFSFQTALFILALSLLLLLMVTFILLPKDMGKTKAKIKFKHLFAKSREINRLSAARLFLFAARDIWFVVALPVYLSSVLGWSHAAVGGFFALWVIGYGVVQAGTPHLIRSAHHNKGPDGATATLWAVMLMLVLAVMTLFFSYGINPEFTLVAGLIVFAIVFAINSAVHSYLILAYSKHDQVSLDVGFYYMANAAGRLSGTVLSGWIYQAWGLEACLWWATGFVLLTALLSVGLPVQKQTLSVVD